MTAGAPRDLHLPHRMVTLGIVVFAASVTAFLVSLGMAISGQRLPMLDLQIYRWAGQVTLHSGDLYGGYFPHKHLPFTYPPMAALIFAALTAIPMAVLIWLVTVGSIACLTGTVWLTLGTLGYRRPASRLSVTLAAAGLSLWFQPVLQTLWLGQVNLVLMFVIAADLSLPNPAWPRGAGVGLAAGFKLVPLIFVLYLMLTRRFRAAGVSLAVFTLTIVGSMIVLPAQSQRFWLTGLVFDAGRTGNVAYVGNQSLHGTLARLLGGAPSAQPYWLATSAAIGIGGLLIAAWAARQGEEMIGILTCAVTGLLISPVSWTHHWVWVAPALVVAADIALRAGTPPAASTRPLPDVGHLPGCGPSPGWRRLAGWSAMAALFMPFLAAPEGVVPATIVEGAGTSGVEYLTSNIYVIEGVAALCLAGSWLLVARARNPEWRYRHWTRAGTGAEDAGIASRNGHIEAGDQFIGR